ncbi:LCP family protein [Gordonia zhaorongruii]|uniref:LCP family glycopolymer transferase n=1 Tax=Gordonia zhaorongruii TaxID=2597659 RepID=UPI0010521B1D|nr:LCP family protein [Gordonia zhaorongruii]
MSSDRPGDNEPDDKRTPPRRSRRAGRPSDSFDFRERFGDTGDDPHAEGLREPTGREQYVRPRGRLTVRQLMDQMGVDDQGRPVQPGSPPAAGPQPPRPGQPGRAPAPPQGRAPQGQQPPGRQAPPQQPPAQAQQHPEYQRRPGEPPRRRPADDADVTSVLPPVTGDDAPPVDLSDEATAARALDESRAQAAAAPTEPTPASQPERQAPQTIPAAEHAESAEPTPSRRRPLEPTPDLTEVIQRVRPRRASATRKARARKMATNSSRVLVALACILSLVGTGYVWNLNRGWNGAWNIISAVDPDDENIRDKDGQSGDQTYLIVGTDSRNGKNADLGAGDATTVEGTRSDTVLLVNIPADRSRVVAVSWPRDLAVERPECEDWNAKTKSYEGSIPPASGVKLNSVYAEGGPSCLVKTLTQVSGLNINHFIAMDFSGFEHVVRAIGGVEVCSRVPLFDDQLGYIVKTPGRKTLTAKQSLNYVRARHIAVEGNGDYGRIKRQQLFMSSLLRGTLSGDVLSNPNKLNSIVNTFIKYSQVDNVNTNALIELAESMQGIDAGNVTFLTVPTAGTSADGNELPRTDDINTIFNAIIDDDPLPGEKKKKSADSEDSEDKPEPPKTSAKKPGGKELTAQYPGNISTRVLNGTGKSGVASNIMDEMIRQGVSVSGVGDSSQKATETIVHYAAGQKDSAATIAKMFPGAKIQADRAVKDGVQVIVGSNFQGMESVGTVPEAGSTLKVGELPAAVNRSGLPNDLAVTNAGDTTCS